MQTKLRGPGQPRSYRLKCLITLVVTAWLSAPVYALTASEVIDRARVYLRDTSSDSSRQRYSDTQLLAWLNDGQREANSFAWILKSSYSFTLSNGTTEYALPSDFVATWRVEYSRRKLDQTSINELDAMSIGWKSASGTPQKYYVYFASTTLLGIYPAPSSSSTGTVTVFYIQQTSDLTSTSQTPFNAWSQLSHYHPSLAYYIAYRGLWSIGETSLAERYYAEWSSWVEAMRTGMLKMPDFNPGLQGRREQ
jgi:hypothetical protein